VSFGAFQDCPAAEALRIETTHGPKKERVLTEEKKNQDAPSMTGRILRPNSFNPATMNRLPAGGAKVPPGLPN
jgi:hypothetical protein